MLQALFFGFFCGGELIPWCEGVILDIWSGYQVYLVSIFWVSVWRHIILWTTLQTPTPVPFPSVTLMSAGLCALTVILFGSQHFYWGRQYKKQRYMYTFNECELWKCVSYQHISYYAALQWWKHEYFVVWGVYFDIFYNLTTSYVYGGMLLISSLLKNTDGLKFFRLCCVQ